MMYNFFAITIEKGINISFCEKFFLHLSLKLYENGQNISATYTLVIHYRDHHSLKKTSSSHEIS